MKSPWVKNAWLALVGLFALWIPLGHGVQGFEGIVRHFFLIGLATLPERTKIEIVALYWSTLAAGVTLLLLWLLFSMRRSIFVHWLCGDRNLQPHHYLLVATLALSFSFLYARIVRQVGMETVYRDLGVSERRAVRYDETNDPVPSAVATFREATADDRRNIVVLRQTPAGEYPGHLPTGHLFEGYYLYPQELYLLKDFSCRLQTPNARWLREREIGWIARECLPFDARGNHLRFERVGGL